MRRKWKYIWSGMLMLLIGLSTNMVTDDQGFHVPTYLIEGEPERGD